MRPAVLVAQFETGAITGTVRDKSGGVLPGVTVTLTNIDTGVVQTATTNDAGVYEFFTLRLGRYDVRASSQGFTPPRVSEVAVGIGARQRVDIALGVGQLSEAVEVSASRLGLERDSSQRGQVVTTEQAVALPLNGREYSALVLLTTGVRASALNTGGLTPREGAFNVNGLRSTFNNFLLDGVDNNAYGTSNQGFSNQVIQPPPDALDEFRVVTNNMSAEYGRSGGATINVAYKSGTNRFSGSAWEFFRDDSPERGRLLHARRGHRAAAATQPVRLRRRRADRPQPRLLLHRLRGLPPGPAASSSFATHPDGRGSGRACFPWTCATRAPASSTRPARPLPMTDVGPHGA